MQTAAPQPAVVLCNCATVALIEMHWGEKSCMVQPVILGGVITGTIIAGGAVAPALC